MDPSVSTRTELDAVRIRRAELRETLNLIEAALAAAARGRAVVWGEAVHASLVMIADDFGTHVEVTEGPDGLHQAILAGDLRLANAVEALTAEHGQMAEEIATLVADSRAPVTPDDVDDLRERATRLLGHLVRHRQRGADLIYAAYGTDIGGGD
jgi:ParB-like chromosome segregation protein Spo0J